MSPAGRKSGVASLASFLGGVGSLLLPKCPLCFGAYGSGLAALGLSPAAQQGLVEGPLAAAVLASFGMVLAISWRRGDLLTPLVSAAGASLVLGGGLGWRRPELAAVGALLLVGAALANTVLCRRAVISVTSGVSRS